MGATLTYYSWYFLFSCRVSPVQRLDGFSRPMPVSRLLSFSPSPPPLAEAVASLWRNSQGPSLSVFALLTRKKKQHCSLPTQSPSQLHSLNSLTYVLSLNQQLKIFKAGLSAFKRGVRGRNFADVAWATQCAVPPIVLAASPWPWCWNDASWREAEARRRRRRARGHDYTTAVHARARKSRSHPLRVKCVTERRRDSSGLELAYFTACTLFKPAGTELFHWDM